MYRITKNDRIQIEIIQYRIVDAIAIDNRIQSKGELRVRAYIMVNDVFSPLIFLGRKILFIKNLQYDILGIYI